MAVAAVTQWKVTPGQQPAFLQNVVKAKPMHERGGARVRAWQATFAGATTGIIAYVTEHDDLAALADFSQKMQADQDWQTLWADAQAAQPLSATVVARALLTELPSGQGSGAAFPSKPGSVMATALLQVTPGRQAQAQEIVAEAVRHLSGAGGRVRVWQNSFAGQQSGTLIVGTEADTLAAFAERTQKLQEGGRWAEFQQRAGAAGHTTVLSQTLWTELPIS